MTLSRSQIDKLGDRLRAPGRPTPDDLRLLDAYERSFHDAHSAIVRRIYEATLLRPTVRPIKTLPSIVAKLRRSSIKLSQIQDIAGCRIVLDTVRHQDEACERLYIGFSGFPDYASVKTIDRRLAPSFGYRAVHLVVVHRQRPVEIQIRTEAQDHWAQLSEKLADRFGMEVKYGGGSKAIREVLVQASGVVKAYEEAERRFESARERYEHSGTRKGPDRRDFEAARKAYLDGRRLLLGTLAEIIGEVERLP